MTGRPRIGEILVRRGVCDQASVEAAAQAQQATGLRLASQIWSTGGASEKDLVIALAEQLGTPAVVIGKSSVELTFVQRLPAMMAHERGLLPIGMTDNCLLVAAADPQDERLVGEMKLISQMNVRVYAALQAAITKGTAGAYALGPHSGTTHFFGWEADQRMPGYRELVQPPEPEVVTEAIPEIDVDILESIEVADGVFAANEEVATQKPSVLLVDDDVTLADMIGTALTQLDLDVIVCNDGREAAAKLQNIQPNVIILDVMLPGMHGFELAQMIKGSERFNGTSLIMMSGAYKGWRVQQDVQTKFAADAYFEKPFELIPLREKVQELLGEGEVNPPGTSEAAVQAFKEGLQAQKAGNLDGAEAQIKRAIQMDPFFLKAHLLLAVIYTTMKRDFLAADALETVIDLDPKNFKALASLAKLYEAQGFRRKAAGTWERALYAAPDDGTKDKIRKRLSALIMQG